MNKSELTDYLKNNFPTYSLFGEFSVLEDVSTNLQGSNKGCAVFYNIQENKKSEELFQERLKQANPSLLILNREIDGLDNYARLIIRREDFLSLQHFLLEQFYPIDWKKFKLVGITGTNGKTSVANLAMEISTQLGQRAYSIGTMGVRDISGEIYAELNATTPSYVELIKILAYFQNDYKAVFFEVSSHALIQKRLYKLKLDALGWTSFSQDHLDYHETMKKYFQAKMLIYNEHRKEGVRLSIPPTEEKLGDKLRNNNIEVNYARKLEDWGWEIPNVFKQGFNRKNLELALTLNQDIWGSLKAIDLGVISPPRGRFSIIELEKGLAIVDYAHTPDALENICGEIKKLYSDYSLTVIFGCGGDRDRLKRPLMAEAVCHYADKIIVTSDNPRTEDPERIIDDIIPGLSNPFERESDRQKAIHLALETMSDKEIILIAGKGHEEYQEIDGKKESFSDFQVVEDFKQRRNA